MALITDPDVATVMDKGVRQTEPLDRIEKIRFDALMSQLFWGCCQVWQRYYHNDDGSWRNDTAPAIVFCLRSPGGANWWRKSRTQFSDGFVKAVDEAEQAAVSRSVDRPRQ